MPKFQVTVEKNYYVSGTIQVEADNADAATIKIQADIESGNLKTNSQAITWNDDLDYIDGSFDITGDVEEA